MKSCIWWHAATDQRRYKFELNCRDIQSRRYTQENSSAKWAVKGGRIEDTRGSENGDGCDKRRRSSIGICATAPTTDARSTPRRAAPDGNRQRKRNTADSNPTTERRAPTSTNTLRLRWLEKNVDSKHEDGHVWRRTEHRRTRALPQHLKVQRAAMRKRLFPASPSNFIVLKEFQQITRATRNAYSTSATTRTRTARRLPGSDGA